MMESAVTAPVRAEASRAPSHPVWWWVGTFAGAFLGCVLLFAVWAKALDPTAFADQIRAEKLDFLFSAQVVALIALALETGLGLALLLGIRRMWVLVPATLLVAFFLFLTGRAWWLDSQGLLPKEASSCGCFGNLVQRTPAQAFWQDLALLVPALLLAFVGRDPHQPRFPPLRTAAAVFGTVAVVIFAWMAPNLPLDDLATRLRPGVQAGDICAGSGEQRICLTSIVPELRQGEHLVVISNLDDPQLTGSIDALNAYASRPGQPRLWVLSSSPAEAHQAFFWQWGPAFDVRETPSELLRPLYRRLPRAFLMKDGRVTRTFGGLPPLSQIAAQSKESFERSSS
ncbi:MAG TPA: MauE/DoxX family redox-associated membrane protein [Thermoanaerobaculia bacterium]|nr:MauE/DoxX family redox-associated membrane protein [Thermoanaerobaculia bacterium]